MQGIIDKTPIGDTNEINPDISNENTYIDCSNYKILIVDDNELNLKVAKKILSKYNFNIETLNSGKDCVYNIKKGDHYDMIFLDHVMPEVDGISCAHVIKRLYGYYPPIVVALTANAITGVREMYLNEGFDEYLSKPINISELNNIINKYFNNK